MDKIIGITADNYKVEKFKAELGKLDITDIEVIDLGRMTKVLKFSVPISRVKEIKDLCHRVELHFHRAN